MKCEMNCIYSHTHTLTVQPIELPASPSKLITYFVERVRALNRVGWLTLSLTWPVCVFAPFGTTHELARAAKVGRQSKKLTCAHWVMAAQAKVMVLAKWTTKMVAPQPLLKQAKWDDSLLMIGRSTASSKRASKEQASSMMVDGFDQCKLSNAFCVGCTKCSLPVDCKARWVEAVKCMCVCWALKKSQRFWRLCWWTIVSKANVSANTMRSECVACSTIRSFALGPVCCTNKTCLSWCTHKEPLQSAERTSKRDRDRDTLKWSKTRTQDTHTHTNMYNNWCEAGAILVVGLTMFSRCCFSAAPSIRVLVSVKHEAKRLIRKLADSMMLAAHTLTHTNINIFKCFLSNMLPVALFLYHNTTTCCCSGAQMSEQEDILELELSAC